MDNPATAGIDNPTKTTHERLTIELKKARTYGRLVPRPMGNTLRLTAGLLDEETSKALVGSEGTMPGLYQAYMLLVPDETPSALLLAI